jgi:hypothetical protein
MTDQHGGDELREKLSALFVRFLDGEWQKVEDFQDQITQLALAYASKRERAAAQQELISLDEILDVKSIVDIRLYIDERMVKLAELQANEEEGDG